MGIGFVGQGGFEETEGDGAMKREMLALRFKQAFQVQPFQRLAL